MVMLMKSSDYWKKRAEQVAATQFNKADDYILALQLEYPETFKF